MDTHGLVLRRAAAIAGGLVPLGARIRVDVTLLERWLSGDRKIPDAIFLRLVDIVLQDDMARAAQDRRHIVRNPDGAAGLPKGDGEPAAEPPIPSEGE
jgi:hypothetical protein